MSTSQPTPSISPAPVRDTKGSWSDNGPRAGPKSAVLGNGVSCRATNYNLPAVIRMLPCCNLTQGLDQTWNSTLQPSTKRTPQSSILASQDTPDDPRPTFAPHSTHLKTWASFNFLEAPKKPRSDTIDPPFSPCPARRNQPPRMPVFNPCPPFRPALAQPLGDPKPCGRQLPRKGLRWEIG